jgi:hypothetical protein
VGWGSFGDDQLFLVGLAGIFSCRSSASAVGFLTLMESLILAQDERWRRA